MKIRLKTVFLLCMVLITAACENTEQSEKHAYVEKGIAMELNAQAEPGNVDKATDRRIPITITTATSRDIEVWEPSVGQLEPKVAPLIAAEVAGQLTTVNFDVGDPIKQGQVLAQIDAEDFQLSSDLAEYDIVRIEALIHAQRLKVERYTALLKKQSVDQSSLDDSSAQLGALRAELASARVRLQQAQRDLGKTTIISPIDGRVDDTQVSRGDYVKVGSALMRIVNLRWLKARLPYPETLLSKLRSGLPIRLHSPSAPDVTIETTISEVRPSITFGSRSIQIIVIVENPGPWQPGATVTGSVRVDLRRNALMLPEISVVRRPAGTVIYIIHEGKALQRRVTTGLRREGQVEILSGLSPGEPVAVDGAGFLSDGIAVEVKGS